jgi:hypothetical protein
MRDGGGTGAEASAALRARLAELGEERGSFEPLGPRHGALFVDESPALLLVTCERLDVLAADGAALPRGVEIADRRGWSALCLLAEGETAWRDEHVFGHLDRRVDEGFFEDFDRVLFYGAGLAGYAACAFSVAAPGAAVLALAPRATLDTDRAAWDERHPRLRRSDFRSRYGYGPEMLEAAAAAVIIHDPAVIEDAAHAAQFAAPHVLRLAWRGLGPDPEATLAAMGLLEPLIALVAEGGADRVALARLWRARRDHGPWLRDLVERTELRGSRGLIRRALRAALARVDSRRLRRRLAALEGGPEGGGD